MTTKEAILKKIKDLKYEGQNVYLNEAIDTVLTVLPPLLDEVERETREKTIKEVKDFAFNLVEDCHPDCTPEEHNYHQGTWVSYRKLDEWADSLLAPSSEKLSKERCTCPNCEYGIEGETEHCIHCQLPKEEVK